MAANFTIQDGLAEHESRILAWLVAQEDGDVIQLHGAWSEPARRCADIAVAALAMVVADISADFRQFSCLRLTAAAERVVAILHPMQHTVWIAELPMPADVRQGMNDLRDRMGDWASSSANQVPMPELRSPIEAIGYLDLDGVWRVAQESRVPGAEEKLEMLAGLIAAELSTAELVIEVGDTAWEIRREVALTTALLRPRQAHPLVVKTALQRIGIRSGRGPVPSSMVIATPVPVRKSAPVRAIRLDDEPQVPFFVQHNSQRSTPSVVIPTATHGAQQVSRPMEDEIEFDMDALLEEGDGRTSDNWRDCTWEAVADYIQKSIDSTAQHVGRTVAANYWREVIRLDEVVGAQLSISVRGTVTVQETLRQVEPWCVRALANVHSRWVARCARVIPDMQRSLVQTLGREPWLLSEPTGN